MSTEITIVQLTPDALRTMIREELARNSRCQSKAMDLEEASAYVRRPATTVKKFWREWGWPNISGGKRLIFHRDDLDRWIEKLKQKEREAA